MGKLEVQTRLITKNPIFCYFFLNWEKLKNPLRATLKNPKFFFELGKTWNCRLRPTLKNPNFESMHKLGKLLS